MSGEGTSQPARTAADLDGLSDEELTHLGAGLDGVRILEREHRFAPGSKAERRAERLVAGCFVIAFLSVVGFIAVYLFYPWRFSLADQRYFLYTPLLGLTMGLALLAVGAGIVLWGKLLMPHETAVQDRHDGFSDETDRRTIAATFRDSLEMTGLARRSLLRRSLFLGSGALGLMAVVPLGGLVKNPWAKKELLGTPWKAGMRLVRLDGVAVRPEDLRPGGMETVFPDVPGGRHAPDGPVMLIRLYPDVTRRPRAGQADYSWGSYVAFSKICTHVGCPTSLYEQQTNKILCPCHQSQFDATRDAKPIFGPATRSLPMLPITVDSEGFFVARSDFREPIGPAFWERRNYD
ncbi:MAG: Rieske (2Fe-2S) protein [Actinobacteria bacterium]|nr:Rieske (2Fe-2S) protein [Actinomycetota bacterium]MBI3688055.1 Rieske (2Fe-2S) protein [Actinomycetota bacterium]